MASINSVLNMLHILPLIFFSAFLIGLNSSAAESKVVQGSYICKPLADPKSLKSLSASLIVHEIPGALEVNFSGRVGIKGLEPKIVEANPAEIQTRLNLLAKSFSECEPNFARPLLRTPNDPLYSQQSSLPYIGAPAAWDLGTGSSSVVVAVLDTGINLAHRDLLPIVWTNSEERENGADDDRNGYIDDTFGVNTVTAAAQPLDLNGHGSHVSGTIGALGNNSLGVTGVAWNVRVVPIKAATDDGYFPTSSLLKALDYVYWLKTARGVNIVAVNASYGSENPLAFSRFERDAIERIGKAEIAFVAAAGNSTNNNDQIPAYPASYDLSNIISVGSISPSERLSTFSNFGARSVHLLAPGEKILSTLNVERSTGLSDTYGRLSGTSMAAPHVTGAYALISSILPYMDMATTINLIVNGSRASAGAANLTKSGKVLNLSSILSALPIDQCPSDPNKISAGACGCGKAEEYTDPDLDYVVGCRDSCPRDPNKSEPGVCGCGVLDSDADSDGFFDCIDQCPSDPQKSAPLVCGCGRSDQDLNNNGAPDCQDANIANLTPPAPIWRWNKGALNITVAERPSASAIIFINTRLSGSKRRPSLQTITANGLTAVVNKLPAGARVDISYRWVIAGNPPYLSLLSPITSSKVPATRR